MRSIPGVGLVLLLVCGLCAGQSLGDAARQNREQKNSSGTTAKKVYTTDDMGAPAPVAKGLNDLSGVWTFTHFDDRFQGTITLRQSGSKLEGTWHTTSGKSEADTTVTGSVDGAMVTLFRSLGPNQQSYSLTLTADGNQLDGFGEGYFLHHTNLNMTRTVAAKPTKPPSGTTR